jgi:hypothetical protein
LAKPNSSDFDLLIKVVKDLEDFLPHLVLVGGWVPFLYVRFLWEETTQDPLMTMDIDFGLRNMAFKGKETIAQRVIKKNYGEHHLEIGKDVPFVPIVQSKKGARADVEFISDENTPEDVRRKFSPCWWRRVFALRRPWNRAAKSHPVNAGLRAP